MLNVVVNGLWGLREESVSSIAERWFCSLDALKDIDGQTFSGWHESGDDPPSDPTLVPSVATLAEYLERKNPGPDLDVAGYTTSLWARNPGAAHVSMAIHAGSTSRYSANSVSLTFRSREVDETAEAVRRAPEILHLLADTWKVDTGQVFDRLQFRTLAERFDLANNDPRCGRAVFLSSRRAAVVPEGLPGTHVRTAEGGLVLDLTCGGDQSPTIETVIEVNALLRAAGALETLPTPFDRDTF